MFDVLTPQVWTLIGNATLETLYMVFASDFLSRVRYSARCYSLYYPTGTN